MINEERLKSMIKLASYEEKTGREDFEISKYYCKDYVSFQTLVTLIWTTIGYVIAAGMIVIINMDRLFTKLTLYKFAVICGAFVLGYLIVLIVYGAAAQTIYKKKHDAAKQNVKRYYRMLGHLNKLYKKENM